MNNQQIKKIFTKPIFIKTAAVIIYVYFLLINITSVKKMIGLDKVQKFWQNDETVIIAFWHNQLMLTPYIWKNKRKNPISVMISQHRDGKLISSVARFLGASIIEGSSKKQGAAALKEFLFHLKNGKSSAITPDGPSGPVFEVKEGVISAARLSGRPILCLGLAYSRKKHAKSWDSLTIPLPFGRTVAIWGDPIFVPKKISAQETENYRIMVQNELIRLTNEANRIANPN